jgi:hypothetical protein
MSRMTDDDTDIVTRLRRQARFDAKHVYDGLTAAINTGESPWRQKAFRDAWKRYEITVAQIAIILAKYKRRSFPRS